MKYIMLVFLVIGCKDKPNKVIKTERAVLALRPSDTLIIHRANVGLPDDTVYGIDTKGLGVITHKGVRTILAPGIYKCGLNYDSLISRSNYLWDSLTQNKKP